MGFSRKAIALCLVIAQLPMGGALASVATNGSFAVDGAGSANYTMPIEVPPGTNGIAPNLSFSYSSQAGVGQLGKGWALSGLSSITRCARTVAQDGVLGGINFDTNDRFCLDGQRLVVVNDKTYGADSAEYRTERESFSKIVSYGTAGSGPASFKVWTKAGQILEYGVTADSRIEAQGKAAVRVWAVNRIEDISTNYLTVSYTEDIANGEFYPSTIDYAGNANSTTAPNASVSFTYENRPDLAPYYVAGSLVNTTKRLAKIQAKTGTSLITEYRLSYLPDSAQMRSRLSSVAQCDSTNTCLPATKFGWQATGDTAISPATWLNTDRSGVGDWAQKLSTVVTMDINGDGKLDFIQLNHRANGYMTLVSFRPVISNGQGFDFGTWVDTELSGELIAGDFNGDGKSDFVVMNSDYTFTIYESQGISFSAKPSSSVSLSQWERCPTVPNVLDIDGDGRSDIVFVCNKNGWPNETESTWTAVLKSNGTTFTTEGWKKLSLAPDGRIWIDASAHLQTFPADLNGDGKMDMVELRGRSMSDGNLWLKPHYSDGQSFNPGAWMDTGIQFDSRGGDYALRQRIVPMDVNGDGLTDIVIGYFSDTYTATPPKVEIFALIATGTGFVKGPISRADQVTFPESYMTLSFKASPAEFFSTDVNNDGRSDLILWWYGPSNTETRNSGTVGIQSLISAGDSFVATDVQETGQPYNTITGTDYSSETGEPRVLSYGPGFVVGDFNGDGKPDLLQQKFFDSTGLVSYLPYYAKGKIGDVVTNIKNGIGSEIRLYYDPLTNDNVYTKDQGSNAAVYPQQDIQNTIYVVSSAQQSNGSGAFVTTDYRYGGAKREFSRQMNQGMRWNSVIDSAKGITVLTENRQDWPYVGMPSKQTMSTSNITLNSTETTYSCTDFVSSSGCTSVPNKHYFAFASQSVVKSADLSGTTFPTVTTTTTYDTWNATTSTWSDLAGIFGNPTEIKISTSDGFIQKTSNVYKNDTDNWFIGKLKRSTQTNTTP